MSGGCQPPSQIALPELAPQSSSWQTYRNDRFDFEFPYPAGWVTGIPPENRDGVTFSDPKNPDVTIRAWAEWRRPGRKSKSKQMLASNFKTEQGIPGRLEIKVENQSSFTVTFYQNNVEYNLQGTASNQQFGSYYRFFNYVASRFRIPEKSQPIGSLPVVLIEQQNLPFTYCREVCAK